MTENLSRLRHPSMDPYLVNYINLDLTWNTVKKRSMTRRPRQARADSLKLGVELGNKMQDSTDFGTEKSGVAVRGQHFAEKAIDVPIKKRRCLPQSPSSRPRTPSLNDEVALLPQPWTPSPHHEESEQLIGRRHASRQWCGSNSFSKNRAPKSNVVLRNSNVLKPTKKEVSNLDDFSGIELLAAAASACDGSIYDSSSHVEESFLVEEHTIPAVDSYAVGKKETVVSIESESLSIQNSTVVTQHFHDNGNDGGEKRPASSEVGRLHWDLNTVMDEWKEPYDFPVDGLSQKNDAEGDYNDGLQRAKLNEEGYETRNSEVSGGEKEKMLDGVIANQLLLDSRSTFATQNDVDCGDYRGSNVSQDEQGPMDEGNIKDKVQAGHDSPFEDGELREPSKFSWEGNEVAERECVDYDSDNIYEDDFDSIEHTMSDKNEARHIHDRTMGDGTSLSEKFKMVGNGLLGAAPKNDIKPGDKADAFRRPNRLLSFNASGHLLSERSEHVVLEENDGGSGKFRRGRKNGHDESRIRKANSLHIDRSSSGVPISGAYTRWSRSGNVEDSYSRTARDFGSENYMGRDRLSYQDRSRNYVRSRQVDSSLGAWDSSSSHGYPRPKRFIGDSAARSGGLSSLDIHQSRNYDPRSTYKTINRTTSPFNRNDSYGLYTGTRPVRGLSRDRCRVGSGFHRAPHEEYHDPEPCYSERKVRCISPNFTRDYHLSQSQRRSHSRSRSGSPIAWYFHKRSDVGTRRQSPDYGYEARFSFRKPKFPGETRASFVSPTREVLSPQRTSRCFGDRSFTNSQFRDRRRSPVGMFQRNQRFESPAYPGRAKSDHFRPSPRPRRLTEPGRDRKYEDYRNDKRKHDDKYETIDRMRRVKYAADRSFDTCSRHKDAVGRDLQERTSEERAPLLAAAGERDDLQD